MTNYLVRSVTITYKNVEAESAEQAEEFAVHENPRTTESYVEVEEEEEE